MASGGWFRAKRYGFGFSPARWQGWLVTALVSALGAGIGVIVHHRGPIWMWLLVPLLAGFFAIVWLTSDQALGWRWGDDDA